MPQKTKTIAVAMIVKNEARHLKDCLKTVRDWVDEIVILDSGSTDATPHIAKGFTDKVYASENWPGFGPQRRIAQAYVVSDYVLWLDADERVTPELRESIKAVLAHPEEKTIYAISRLSWVFGRFIRHCGWYPDHVVRLYQTGSTQYDDAVVHEKVEVPEGMRIKKLKGDAIHYTYDDLNHYLVKSARYAKAWADQREKQNKKSCLSQGILHGLARFIKMYIFKAGFLDGKPGFLLSVLSGHSTFVKYADLWTRTLSKPGDN